jgi:hypothetical protein
MTVEYAETNQISTFLITSNFVQMPETPITTVKIFQSATFHLQESIQTEMLPPLGILAHSLASRLLNSYSDERSKGNAAT